LLAYVSKKIKSAVAMSGNLQVWQFSSASLHVARTIISQTYRWKAEIGWTLISSQFQGMPTFALDKMASKATLKNISDLQFITSVLGKSLQFQMCIYASK